MLQRGVLRLLQRDVCDNVTTGLKVKYHAREGRGVGGGGSRRHTGEGGGAAGHAAMLALGCLHGLSQVMQQ